MLHNSFQTGRRLLKFEATQTRSDRMSQETEANFSSSNDAGRNFAPKARLDFSSSSGPGRNFAPKAGLDFSSSSSPGRNYVPKAGLDFSSSRSPGRNLAQKTGLDFSVSNSTGITFNTKTEINFSPSSSAGTNFAAKTGIDFSSSSSPGRSFAPSTANPGYVNDSRSHQIMQQQQYEQQLDHPQHSLQLQPKLPYPMYPSPPMFAYGVPMPLQGFPGQALAKAMSSLNAEKNRTSRSKKKTTPEDKKDDTYFERRRRNNEAAKKSRDNRKSREDELALHASELQQLQSMLLPKIKILQHENQMLRAQYALKFHKMLKQERENKIENLSQDNVQNSDGQGKA